MKELVAKYPSIVARPYLLIKDDLQRKDMQRFWFENTISFLAILAGSDLVRWYKEIKYKENKNDKDTEILKALQNHPSLTNVGLDHMSLGKWVMMLRETIKTLKDYNVKVVFPEILNFYNKDTEKVINKFVTIRNNDAHGNPIPENKLKAELDKRQELIDFLVKELSFLEKYRLIMPEEIEIEGSKQLYLIKEFKGNNVIVSKEDFDFSLRLNDVAVINKDKYLSILPYIIYLGKKDESKNFLGIFSKYTDKDQKNLKYLNLEGSGEVDFEKDTNIYQIDLFEERKNWNEIYTNPKSNQVNINANLKFNYDNLKVGEEGLFSIVLDNKKSTTLYDIKIIVEIPKIMEIVQVPENEFISKIDVTDSSLIISVDSLEEQLYKIEDIKFKITEQGFLNISSANLFFKYYFTEMNEEANIFHEGEAEIVGDEIEIVDPSSKDKMVPVINIRKEFLNTNLEPISHVKIGEDFVFEVKVKNIGFSSAKDIFIDVLFPDGLNLKKGKETIRMSNLNPMEERNFQYVFSSEISDIYTIDMQNVTFSDVNNKRYVTKCSDEYFLVVRSDILTEFKFKIKEFIKDLYINEDEQREIDETIKEIETKLDIDAKTLYQEVEVETVINIMRGIIKKAIQKRNLQFVESIYEESKSDSNLTGKERRKSLVFSCDGIPFFAINLTNQFKPEFFGLKTDITKRFDEVKKSMLVVSDGKFPLEHKVKYNTIRDTEKYSIPFLNQWINFILNKLEKEYLIWKSLTKKVSEYFDMHFNYLQGMYFGEYHQNSVIRTIRVLLDRKNKKFLVTFELNERFKNLTKNDLYLRIGLTKETEFDDVILSKYTTVVDKITKAPAVILNLKSIDDIEKEFKKVENLYNEILYVNSFQLVDKELHNFVEEVYKQECVLKKDDYWNNDTLLIYNYKDYKDFEIMPEESISMIENTKKGAIVYPKTYSYFSKEANELIEFHKFHWVKKQPLKFIKANFSDEIANEILNTAKEYRKSKKFVWPNKKQAILNYGELEYGVFLVAKCFYKGINSFEEVKKEFPDEKDFNWFISRINKLENEYKFISPIIYEENKFYIDEKFKEAFDELYHEDPEFNYITGNALIRLRLNNFKNQLELFKNKRMGVTWVSKSLCKGEKYCKDVVISITLGINILAFAIEFTEFENSLKEIVKDFYWGENITMRKSGKNDQHLKILLSLDTENFEENFEENVKKAEEFFDKCVEFSNKYICICEKDN